MLGRLRPHWRRDAGLPARIDALLGGDRRLGSRDRRFYREMIYTALRYLPWVEPLLDADPDEALRRIAWLSTDAEAARPFRSEVSAGLPDCPASAEEKALILGANLEALSPSWLGAECPEAVRTPMRDVLLSRAPLWLRLQAADPAAALSEFDGLGWAWRRSPLLAGAVELPAGADVVKTQAYLGGAVEIQDIGSQLILETVGVRPGGQWLDACAGAGGKTLQLAVMLGTAGSATARDPRRAALEQLAARATRAGLEGRIRIGSGSEPRHGYDGVLVDAPCSGSGTWRRAPHLRWVTSPASLRAAAILQRRLLRENAPRVRAGGLLVYATCSLCRSENESVAEAFLSGNPGFVPEIFGRRLEPQAHDGDGFFVASFRRTLPGGPLSSRP
jgi:16S rRNA (cytosine967-C5)-methyltransferase